MSKFEREIHGRKLSFKMCDFVEVDKLFDNSFATFMRKHLNPVYFPIISKLFTNSLHQLHASYLESREASDCEQTAVYITTNFLIHPSSNFVYTFFEHKQKRRKQIFVEPLKQNTSFKRLTEHESILI
jgi:hypothetical protein